jgi:DNA-binding GntR family transcriptional regulator
MEARSRKSICQKVALRLEADLPSYQGHRLPPIHELYHKYGVSSKTMVKAAAILRDKGLLWYSEGKPMMIVGRSVAEKPDSGTAVPLVSHYIKGKIQHGQFKAGQPLPKAYFFISKCGVSRGSVVKALRVLAGQG